MMKMIAIMILTLLVCTGLANADQVVLDDVIVDGSQCIGMDCVDGETFGASGFATLKFNENNLRILFQDSSSTSSFPSNDWQITVNDTADGGDNKFAIEDITGATTPFSLDTSGNLTITGTLNQGSDVGSKHNIVPVEPHTVLTKVKALPVATWSYRADDPAITHIGPMAQDFFRAFGLGKDERHLAPNDLAGVALVGVQALTERLKENEQHIAALEAQLRALRTLVETAIASEPPKQLAPASAQRSY